METVTCRKLDRTVADCVNLFQTYYGHLKNIQYVQAPGRVNIIGEHIDYCGYSVFPMAIENNIFVVFKTNSFSNQIRLRNVNPIYQQIDIDTNDFAINDVTPKWYDYFLCGYQGILDYAKENHLELQRVGIDGLVDGNIPPNAGLSSSSALVVASAVVTMVAFGLNIDRLKLAEICAKSEKYIGTQGGGMDQCISLTAQRNSAMLIDFSSPEIVSQNVFLPSNAVFVVTNCLQQMNKAASNQFNQRVMEAKLSAKVLLKLLKPDEDCLRYRRMVDVQQTLGLDFASMLYNAKELLKETYSRQELLAILNITDESLNNEILSKNTQDMQQFHLKRRAIHIISEADRVIHFKNICLESKDDNVLMQLGKLMNESHDSCRDMYECSSSELDKLVNVCRKAGSYGSRLTGAGWGGCSISLVSREKVPEFLKDVQQNYYQSYKGDLSNVIFVTQPSDGAAILF